MLNNFCVKCVVLNFRCKYKLGTICREKRMGCATALRTYAGVEAASTVRNHQSHRYGFL